MSAQQAQTIAMVCVLIRKLNVISRNIDMDRVYLGRIKIKQAMVQAKLN